MTAPAFDTPLHIHHGDCIDYLAGLPGGCIDLVVTDPPYGIAYKTGHGTASPGRSRTTATCRSWRPWCRTCPAC